MEEALGGNSLLIRPEDVKDGNQFLETRKGLEIKGTRRRASELFGTGSALQGDATSDGFSCKTTDPLWPHRTQRPHGKCCKMGQDPILGS